VYRALSLTILCLGIAPRLAAQEVPTPAQQQALTGKWLLDQAKSDSLPSPADALARAGGGRALGGGGGRGGGGGGGGGGRGRGSAGGAAAAPPVDAAPPAAAPSGGGRGNPAMVQALAEFNPGSGVIIAVNDSVVAIATAAMLKSSPDNAQSNWKTDGKKHQDAQMDGSVIETQSGWRDGVLTIMNGVQNVVSLKREFKLGKDGKTLEMKETVEAGGRKADYKLVFNKG
jgi:hypothetical protein